MDRTGVLRWDDRWADGLSRGFRADGRLLYSIVRQKDVYFLLKGHWTNYPASEMGAFVSAEDAKLAAESDATPFLIHLYRAIRGLATKSTKEEALGNLQTESSNRESAGGPNIPPASGTGNGA